MADKYTQAQGLLNQGLNTAVGIEQQNKEALLKQGQQLYKQAQDQQKLFLDLAGNDKFPDGIRLNAWNNAAGLGKITGTQIPAMDGWDKASAEVAKAYGLLLQKAQEDPNIQKNLGPLSQMILSYGLQNSGSKQETEQMLKTAQAFQGSPTTVKIGDQEVQGTQGLGGFQPFQVNNQVAKSPNVPVKQFELSSERRVDDLSQQFQNQSKQFRDVASSYQRVIKSAKDSSAAGDLALIFNYMKVLDPGSVVREGEFATAETAGSIPNRVVAQYNKVLKGERLSEEQRNDFVDRAKRLYEGAEELQTQYENQTTEKAKASGIDPKRVITDYRVKDEIEDPLTAELKKRGLLK